MEPVTSIRVALDRALASDGPEIRYAFRALLRTAGYGVEFVWADQSPSPGDIYYGPDPAGRSESVQIARGQIAFSDAGSVEPDRLVEVNGLTALGFPGDSPTGSDQAVVRFETDLVFSTYWLLTGAREAHYPRDGWDNLDLDGTAARRLQLMSRPLVSEWAIWLRNRFEAAGKAAADWARARGRAQVAITHDVDYPEIIRWIEVLRCLAGGRVGHAAGVLSGRESFWQFPAWARFSESLGGRSTFFFMARRGSLWQYARKTPDAFYDIESPRFSRLFAELRDTGHEVGLHLSYHAHRSADTMRAERERLSEASGGEVRGNRHHYWHLDPANPNETLRRHVSAGLQFDSSLAFEFYPGFRRGMAHPFRPFDPVARSEMDLVEVPPTWMDDHFDQRLDRNGIADPRTAAEDLVQGAARTDGVLVLDYHVRGMNRNFFPRYGAWLEEFFSNRSNDDLHFTSMQNIVDRYVQHEATLDGISRDRTEEAA